MDPKRDKSRSAAKSRRSSEAEIYAQLEESLPSIDQPTIYQLDRIAVLRLSLTLCRLRRVAERFLSTPGESSSYKTAYTHGSRKCHFTDTVVHEAISEIGISHAMDGFVMMVNKGGQILFVTSSVVDCIGFTQTDLLGRYLRDYVHVGDWPEMRDQLCKANNTDQDLFSPFSPETFFRMKTALTARGGRARKLTVAVYEPLQAHFVKPIAKGGPTFGGFDCCEGANDTARLDEEIRLIYCLPFSLSSTRRRTSSSAIPLIVSRHELDMRFRNCDENIAKVLGHHNAKSLHGRSFFDIVHPNDVKSIVECISKMHGQGWASTGYYRLLSENGDPVWAVTEMMRMSQNIRGTEHKSVVCAHQFMSAHKISIPHRPIDHHLISESNEHEDMPSLTEMDKTNKPPPVWTDSFVDTFQDGKIHLSTANQPVQPPPSSISRPAQQVPQRAFNTGPSSCMNFYEDRPSRRTRSNSTNGSLKEHIKSESIMLAAVERKHRLDCKTVDSFLKESWQIGSHTSGAMRKKSYDDFHLDELCRQQKRVSLLCGETDVDSIQKELLRDYFK